jgi:hypothetical protein
MMRPEAPLIVLADCDDVCISVYGFFFFLFNRVVLQMHAEKTRRKDRVRLQVPERHLRRTNERSRDLLTRGWCIATLIFDTTIDDASARPSSSQYTVSRKIESVA